jgi:hypothetical protein
MEELEFETKPLKSGGKTTGYRLMACVPETWQGEGVFEEIAKRSGLNIPAVTLEYIFNTVIKVTRELVMKDGRPRRIGNLKFMPVIKGQVESPYSSFDLETCKAMVAPSLRKGWEEEIRSTEVDIVNKQVGKRVKLVKRIGAPKLGEWTRGCKLLIAGENVELIDGDSVTVRWMEGGEQKSVALEVVSTSSILSEMKWPKELEKVSAGTKIDVVLRSRGGIVDGVWQTRYRRLTLVEKV